MSYHPASVNPYVDYIVCSLLHLNGTATSWVNQLPMPHAVLGSEERAVTCELVDAWRPEEAMRIPWLNDGQLTEDDGDVDCKKAEVG